MNSHPNWFGTSAHVRYSHPDGPSSMLTSILRDHAPQRIKNALDLGTGGGRHLPVLRACDCDQLFATDIEFEEEILESNTDVSFSIGSIADTLERCPPVDLLVSWRCLHNLESVESLIQAIGAIQATLAPGGLFVAAVRADAPDARATAPVAREIEGVFGRRSDLYFSERSIRACLLPAFGGSAELVALERFDEGETYTLPDGSQHPVTNTYWALALKSSKKRIRVRGEAA